ncbi:MAG: glycosyltransferase family 2 protein [Candidatus Altiarchaeota archaeon]
MEKYSPGGITAVVPALNEQDSIRAVIEGLKPLADEIIVVDGHSRDRTAEIARKCGASVLFDEVGKGSAVRKGFSEARGGIVVMVDADCSHRPEEVAKAVKKIREGYDVCMPSRFMEGGGSEDITPLRVFGNGFYKFWVRLFWGVSYTDICYGFRAFSRSALKKLDLSADGFDLEVEIAIKTAKKGLKFVEIPSLELKRKSGSGKLGFWTSLVLDRRILLELFD